jgi:hypothetical protein
VGDQAFEVFALDTKLNLETDSQANLPRSMDGHVADEGILVGRTRSEDRFPLGSSLGTIAPTIETMRFPSRVTVTSASDSADRLYAVT